jgi:hypothetical protein
VGSAIAFPRGLMGNPSRWLRVTSCGLSRRRCADRVLPGATLIVDSVLVPPGAQRLLAVQHLAGDGPGTGRHGPSRDTPPHSPPKPPARTGSATAPPRNCLTPLLPGLPIEADVPPSRRAPRHLRTAIASAVNDRNRVLHLGVVPRNGLRAILLAIRDFPYLLDSGAPGPKLLTTRPGPRWQGHRPQAPGEHIRPLKCDFPGRRYP